MSTFIFAMGVMQANATAVTVYQDDFDGSSVDLNGVAPDVGSGNWVATPSTFLANGTIANAGSGNAGTATLAFTPVNGLVYTLDTSFNLTQNDTWLAFGFANGQSTSNGDGKDGRDENRFLEEGTTGIAWSLVQGTQVGSDGILGETPDNGLSDRADWVGGPDGTGAFDLRIVLDTTGGTGNWTATWYAKTNIASNYTTVRATATLLDEAGINSVGFGVGGDGVVGSITSFSLVSIPELSSYALLAGCLGLASVMLRRRRS